MRILVLSDIHSEFHVDSGKQFVSSLDPTGIDVVVLAGDAGNSETFESCLRFTCERFKHVIFVPGNHEYYFSGFDVVNAKLKRLAKEIPNLTVLNNAVTTISGQRFVGSTMWFTPDPMSLVYADGLADFSEIVKFPQRFEEINRTAVKFLKENIQHGDIVVTHHLPTPLSVAGRYKSSNLTRYYLCDMSELILRVVPFLWIHGHAHEPVDYFFGDTRILCNPAGYPREQAKRPFNPLRGIVEV